MPFKTLLTVVTPHEAAQTDLSVFDAAIDLARRNDAHLEVLAIGLDQTAYGYFYSEASMSILQDTLDQALLEARDLDTRVRERLAREDIRWSSEDAVSQAGAIASLISQRARFSDLVVLNRPYGPGRSNADVAVLEAALFDADVPVLLLPEGATAVPEASRIVVAWNQSPEALAAIRAALPLLRQASHVDIAVIDPIDQGPETAEPGGALGQWLARHDVRAEVSVLARGGAKISDVLIRHMRDRDGDMLIMGAYGHSRFRQAILGGATRDLLEHAPFPVFMAR